MNNKQEAIEGYVWKCKNRMNPMIVLEGKRTCVWDFEGLCYCGGANNFKQPCTAILCKLVKIHQVEEQQ